MIGGKIPVIMPGWKWVMFEKAVTHMIPNEVYDVIVDDLLRRGCPVAETQEAAYLFLDQPGIISNARPTEHVTLDGLDLEIPSEDIGSFLLELQSLPLRGGCYYKLHGFHRCIVLTQVQRSTLLFWLRDVFPDAEARAAQFWMGKKLPSQLFHRTAEAGSSPLDRFKVIKGSGSLPN